MVKDFDSWFAEYYPRPSGLDVGYLEQLIESGELIQRKRREELAELRLWLARKQGAHAAWAKS